MSQQCDGGRLEFAVESQALLKKIAWRLLPFLFLMFAISFLDRINIGFAALSMNKDLQLTATAFGFVTTIFYVGYVLCEDHLGACCGGDDVRR
jgi:sugar phosphate permease